MTPLALCEGLGMHACDACFRNVDNHPESERAVGQKWLRPAADPPRCLDFVPIPHKATDNTHARL